MYIHQYIHDRLKDLGKQYELRILLVQVCDICEQFKYIILHPEWLNKSIWINLFLQVDIKDPYIPIKELTKMCLLADLTLLLSWDAQEAGKIIETYKVFEHKPPDLIMGKQESTSTLSGVIRIHNIIFTYFIMTCSKIIIDCW